MKDESNSNLQLSSEDKQMEESKEYSEIDEDKDLIAFEDQELMQEAIDSINVSKFKILNMIRFYTLNSFVNHCAINDDCTRIILSCSDRVLRLYDIDFNLLS